MGMKLKTCLASLAMLVAAAAQADGTASGNPSGEAATAYRSTEASAGQATRHVAANRYAASGKQEAAGEEEGAVNPCDQHAGAGSGSGEPKRALETNWNSEEFLRNVWNTP
jgi:hypothetical protein